jgi:hypothetical protein
MNEASIKYFFHDELFIHMNFTQKFREMIFLGTKFLNNLNDYHISIILLTMFSE